MAAEPVDAILAPDRWGATRSQPRQLDASTIASYCL